MKNKSQKKSLKNEERKGKRREKAKEGEMERERTPWRSKRRQSGGGAVSKRNEIM